MKALTIHQPWASLIAWGVKTFETRGWKCAYRGAIAIHAGKKHIDYFDFAELHIKLKHQLPDFNQTYLDSTKGAIIAIANLKAIHYMNNDFIEQQTEIERMCGYWQPGRYAWELVDVSLIDPIFIRGQQGLWDIPPSLQKSLNLKLPRNS